MGFLDRIFGKDSSSTPKAGEPSKRDLKRIEDLGRQLRLPRDEQTADGVYTGQEAEQYLRERGIQPPSTSAPLQVVDTSRMRVVDKNLGVRISAAKELGRIGGRAALVALENASHKIYEEESKGVHWEREVTDAISQSIEHITMMEVERQGGQEALQAYQEMKDAAIAYVEAYPRPRLLFDRGLIFFFGMMGLPQSIEFLQQSLDSDDFEVRRDAVEELGNLGRRYSYTSWQVMGVLSRFLESDVAPEVRSSAAQALGGLCQALRELDQKRSLLACLFSALADPDINVRNSVVEASKRLLTQMMVRRDNHPYGASEIKTLKQALDDPDPDIQQFATDQLVKIGELDPMNMLLELCRAPEAETRRRAASELGEFGDARAINVLVDMLNDPDEFVRVLAARSLGRVGDLSVIDALSKALASVGEDVRFHFTDAIAEIRERVRKPDQRMHNNPD